MKHLIISLVYLLALSNVFCACNDDDENAVYINPQTPDIIAAGTYEGEWERILLSDSTVKVEPGTVIITSDTAYIVKLQFSSEAFSLQKEAFGNITYADGGFYYFNYSTVNELKAPFVGSVDGNHVNRVSFTIKQADGRKIKEFKYTFKGLKVSTVGTSNVETKVE